MRTVENIWVNVCAVVPNNCAKLLVYPNRAKQFRVFSQRFEDRPTQQWFKINDFLLAICKLKMDPKLF